ncbi:MAG TPA: hypothetical protein VKZ77_01585 [Bacillaceae bacterium]|nr:hypothetical protein [Bacillaceae bacterium]
MAHGEWTSWCEKEIGMTIMQANKFIKVFEEVGDGANLKSTLGIEALYQIATLPPEERKAYRLIDRYKLDLDNLSKTDMLENMPVSLTYEIAMKS